MIRSRLRLRAFSQDLDRTCLEADTKSRVLHVALIHMLSMSSLQLYCWRLSKGTSILDAMEGKCQLQVCIALHFAK